MKTITTKIILIIIFFHSFNVFAENKFELNKDINKYDVDDFLKKNSQNDTEKKQEVVQIEYVKTEKLNISDVESSLRKNIDGLGGKSPIKIVEFIGIHQTNNIAYIYFKWKPGRMHDNRDGVSLDVAKCLNLNDGRWFCMSQFRHSDALVVDIDTFLTK